MRSTILLLGSVSMAAIAAASFVGCGGDAADVCDFGECVAPDVDSGPPFQGTPFDAGNDAASGNGGDATSDGDAAASSCDAGSPDQDPCFVTEANGVFVAPSGSDSNAGTRAAPFATIGKAVAVAAQRASGKNVFACADSYLETVAFTSADDGVAIFGALGCPGSASAWTYVSGTHAVVAPSGAGPALVIHGITGGVALSDLELDTNDVTAAGASNVAALVDSSVATFTRVTFKSGAAGKGDDGASTTNYANATASDGKPATNNQGGPSVVCQCTNADTSTGALGGTGDVATPTGGGNGLPNLNGTNPNDGKGGAGALAASTDCTNGDRGASGGGGAAGIATSLTIALTASGIGESGGVGGNGGAGKVAQGGGGGGGGLYTAGTPAGGGGGGACGGCGGGGGTGGKPGGTSVALASFSANVTLNGCKVIAGKGGNGGQGGSGQAGQPGGSKGQANGNGCQGGPGGTGGAGGGGAGGAGGSSFAIAYTGTAPASDAATTTSESGAGTGGPAGSPNGAKGNDGATADSQSL